MEGENSLRARRDLFSKPLFDLVTNLETLSCLLLDGARALATESFRKAGALAEEVVGRGR